MKNTILRRTTFALILLTVSTVGVMAQTQSSRQVRTVLDSIRTKATTLQRDIDRGRFYSTGNNADDRVSTQLTGLSNDANSLRSATYNRNADTTTDMNALLERATRINRILSRNEANARIMTQWTSLRTDINTLAGYYGMSWNWNDNGGNNNNNGGYNNGGNNNGGGWNNAQWNDRVTGTYRLNVSQSDNVTDVINRSLGSYSQDQRDNQRGMLERRLAAPDVIAIQKSGRSVTMGSSNQPQVTFEADGVAHNETNNRGRTVTTRVTSSTNNLVIDYSGDRVNDFNVTFAADRNGRLRVTRKIYLENQNQTISTSSIYDRISQTADWSAVRQDNNSGGYNGNNGGSSTTGGYYIPNGTSLTATLRNTVSTKASQVGDRFTLDVTAPNNYRGAVIEGHVSQAGNSGRVTGRANLQLDFDTITVNGRSYQFAGFIQNVTSANGDSVSVNNEGTIKDGSQTTKTATRAGIGAVLGAIIGAVAGGGSGAAIGAGVGAGAGAGTVLLGGKDSIELGQGSTFTIQSSAPANVGSVRN